MEATLTNCCYFFRMLKTVFFSGKKKGFLAPGMEANRIDYSISSPHWHYGLFSQPMVQGVLFLQWSCWDTLGGATNVTFVSNVFCSSLLVNVSASSGICDNQRPENITSIKRLKWVEL